ncbi:MAG: hypothetical protein JNK35_02020 [Phycisphaerae bacterium]|nr:hypothetical protein [Phycisphaerae bacterium]
MDADPAQVDPRLQSAVTRAQAAETIGRVVDESIERSARAREQREAAEAERREKEARDQRRREEQRLEREAAEALAERYQWVTRYAKDDARRPAPRRIAPEPRAGLDLAA